MIYEALFFFYIAKLRLRSLPLVFHLIFMIVFCAIGKPFFFSPAGRMTLQCINSMFATLFIEYYSVLFFIEYQLVFKFIKLLFFTIVNYIVLRF